MEGFLEEEVQGGPLGQGRGCASQAGNTGQRPLFIAPLLKAYTWLNSRLCPYSPHLLLIRKGSWAHQPQLQ